jgi:hypothetical protein
VTPVDDPALPAWSARLIAQLTESDRRTRAVVDALDDDALNRQPRPNSWSLAQCLNHLCLANEVYLPAIAAALNGRPPGRAETISLSGLSRWFIREYIAPAPPGKRRRAPGQIVPPERVDPSILERFLRINDEARRLIRRASAFDVNRIRFRNPFVPLIRFTVGTGLEIVSQHEQRHLAQAERVRMFLGATGDGSA